MELHKIIEIRDLTSTVYVVRIERNAFQFVPGQVICVGVQGDDDRPYSIYSGVNDDYIEILVKEVKKGNISKKLRQFKKAMTVTVRKPSGSFCIDEGLLNEQKPLVFVSTGTGIAPFHSYVKSYEQLNYKLIHGVRFAEEAYESTHYAHGAYTLCTTVDEGDFSGRVTDYLRQAVLDSNANYFLCGSYDMIDEVVDILVSKGIINLQIKTEGYF